MRLLENSLNCQGVNAKLSLDLLLPTRPRPHGVGSSPSLTCVGLTQRGQREPLPAWVGWRAVSHSPRGGGCPLSEHPCALTKASLHTSRPTRIPPAALASWRYGCQRGKKALHAWLCPAGLRQGYGRTVHVCLRHQIFHSVVASASGLQMTGPAHFTKRS